MYVNLKVLQRWVGENWGTVIRKVSHPFCANRTHGHVRKWEFKCSKLTLPFTGPPRGGSGGQRTRGPEGQGARLPECSFSTLARVKNVIRSTMLQDRLKSLGTLAVEARPARTVDFNSIIEPFASRKARKVPLL